MADQELRAARAIAKSGGAVEHRIVEVPQVREAGDMKSEALSGVPRTYIPMKNAIYYSLAASYAEETGTGTIMGGHNVDDKHVFPDTGEDFFASLQAAFLEGSPRLRKAGLTIVRPLRERHKSEVVSLAVALGVPLEATWSCNRDGLRHCGDCEGCRARAKAFDEAGATDPVGLKKV